MAKFEKVLLLLNVILQFGATSAIIIISGEIQATIVMAVITTVCFFAVHFKDPGYLVIDEKCKLQLGKHCPDFSQIQKQQEELEEGKETCKRMNQLINQQQSKKTQTQEDKRFCRICMISQPYRMKHCHECEKCVATFDHHCPWMNTCIGQKNRHFFIVYLIFQTLQFLIGGICVCENAVLSINMSQSQWIFGVVLIMLLFFMLGLLIFHCYLMGQNITTCKYIDSEGQFARWETIIYLKNCKRGEGSPFSKGILKNICSYWEWGFRKNRKIWENDISASQ